MNKASSLKWWLLLISAFSGAAYAWSRTHNWLWALASGAALLFVGGSWVAGSNSVSAYTQVLDRAADAVHAPQATAAYQVRRLLTRFRYDPSVEGLAELALTQLKQIEGHFHHFEKSLGEKLNEGETTYDRYHAAGVQAFDGVMQNLRTGASLIEQCSRARNSELVTKLETIFSKNDEALHGFEKINAALEEMTGQSSPARLQAAIDDLEGLAQQAHKYATNRES